MRKGKIFRRVAIVALVLTMIANQCQQLKVRY